MPIQAGCEPQAAVCSPLRLAHGQLSPQLIQNLGPLCSWPLLFVSQHLLPQQEGGAGTEVLHSQGQKGGWECRTAVHM